MARTNDHVVDGDKSPNCDSAVPGESPYSLGMLLAASARMIEALSEHELTPEVRAEAELLVIDLRDLASEFTRD